MLKYNSCPSTEFISEYTQNGGNFVSASMCYKLSYSGINCGWKASMIGLLPPGVPLFYHISILNVVRRKCHDGNSSSIMLYVIKILFIYMYKFLLIIYTIFSPKIRGKFCILPYDYSTNLIDHRRSICWWTYDRTNKYVMEVATIPSTSWHENKAYPRQQQNAIKALYY